jgi:hypothetical protein
MMSSEDEFFKALTSPTVVYPGIFIAWGEGRQGIFRGG